MTNVSLLRLYLLRAVYLLSVVGLGVVVWPGVIRHESWELFEGAVQCMLAAYSLLCILGLRYPLQMLPVLLWEVIWKTLWLTIVALPQWWAGHIDESIQSTIFANSMVLLFYFAIPWRYVAANYVMKRGERWR